MLAWYSADAGGTMKLRAKLWCGLIALSVALVGLGGVAAADSSPAPHNLGTHIEFRIHVGDRVSPNLGPFELRHDVPEILDPFELIHVPENWHHHF
jgi:hypothetical protein